jgi:predicted house-cleaning NTP pyrophosphatase (Maf/HAM1 superfamily)
MTAPEQFSPKEAEERDERLERWLTDFHTISDPDLNVLRFNLRKSWERYVNEHAFRLSQQMAFEPESRIKTRTEECVTAVRIRTGSDKKWHALAPFLTQAGFQPVRDATPFDEEEEHHWLRTQHDFPNRYTMRVAHSKQAFDMLPTPVFTLDTVTYVNGQPMEKPKNEKEAILMAQSMSGMLVSAETGWVFGIQVKSGASIVLLNRTSIAYHIKPILSPGIIHYIKTAPSIFDVSGGIDLSTVRSRLRFIDMTQPITYFSENNYGEAGQLTLYGRDLESPLFDTLFAGVPIQAINAFLPLINNIYLHGDPLYNEDQKQ